MKELVFKLTVGKPPFIGIRFDDVHKGENLNKDLIIDYKDTEFILFLEPIGSTLINLRLCCDEPPIMRKYDRLNYNKYDFEAFFRNKSDKRNFGHIIKTYDYDVPIKITPNRQMFVLKLKEVKILYEE